jgi:uncharacterized protein (DUF4415 family)
MTSAGLYAWDERKRAANLRKHRVDFAIVQDFDFETALVLRDDRKNYGEERFRAYARLTADFTPSSSHAVRDESASFRCAKATQGRSQTMPRARHHRRRDLVNPEWTKEDFARAQPASEVVPEIVAAYRRVRGPQKRPTKRLVSLRLDPDVIEHFRARGPGWQARINTTLRKAVGLS